MTEFSMTDVEIESGIDVIWTSLSVTAGQLNNNEKFSNWKLAQKNTIECDPHNGRSFCIERVVLFAVQVYCLCQVFI